MRKQRPGRPPSGSGGGASPNAREDATRAALREYLRTRRIYNLAEASWEVRSDTVISRLRRDLYREVRRTWCLESAEATDTARNSYAASPRQRTSYVRMRVGLQRR